VIDAGEACDDGAGNSDSAPDACRTTCAAAGCGDGVIDAGEACDDGAGNSDSAPDACRTGCQAATCGDGVIDTGEACDDGAGNSDSAPDACRTGCQAATCGDGVIDAGETCDDADESATCDADCTAVACGDGTTNVMAGEACDGADVASCLGTCDADCGCTAGPHTLMVSGSPDRSAPEPLHGMSVTGDIFVFLNSGLSISQVLFYLDDDDQSGPPARVEGKAPYDLAGTRLDGTANALHTTDLTDGAHSISAVVDTPDGESAVVAATFFVGNDTAALAFTTRTMAFVLAESEGLASQTVGLNTTDGSVASYTTSVSADWLEIAPVSGTTPDTLTVLVDPVGEPPGIHTGSVTVSAPGYVNDVLTVSMQVGDPGDCAPVACSQILVDAPYVLTFDEDHGQIHDAAGIGTGFTYIDEPTNGAGYIPGNLTMDTTAGVLAITTTPGLQYQGTNALDNALGVGIDAPSHVSVLTTTLLSPPVGTGGFEQAGLWFGNDEENHVKLVVLSTSVGTKIQFLLEVGGQALAEKKTGVLDLDGAAVALRLRIDPVSRSIQAAYQLDGGPIEIVTTFVVPPEFLSFDAAGIDPTIGTRSFGGVFASHRNGPAPLVYTFDDFTLDVEVFVPSTGDISFTRTSAPVFKPTSLAWAPDGRLYVTELLGTMHALTFGPDKTLVDDEVINALTDAVGPRLTLGLTIDPASTPDDVTLWVSHSSPSLNNGTPNSAMVSRLSGAGFATVEHVISGLPRAKANHSVNSIHFGPDGRLYIAAGGNTGAGAPNQANTEFGEMSEQPLSAALLVADVVGAGFDGTCDNSTDLFGPPPCDVVPYATGMRNMYDFVFHRNGSLYGPENGLGITGTYPPSPSAPCLGFGDPAPFNAMPPGHNPGEQPDLLLRILPGLYYGHPNPYRNECVFKDGSFQGVPPLPNWSPPLFTLGSNRSANGIIEYGNDEEFCGALSGDLLISNFSVGDDLTRVRLSADGLSVLDATSVAGGFDDPLPVAQDPDGTVYVGEFGTDQVTALVPMRSGCWTPVAGAPEAVLDAGGATLNGKLYMVAGKTLAGPIRSVNVYDPASDAWSGLADLPGAAVENPAVVGHDGRLYVFGGSTGPFTGAVTDAAAFEPGSGWTSLAPMPTARGGATAQVLGGLVYVVGGLDGSGASLDSVDVYDPASDMWSSAASMSTRRDNPGSAVLGGKLYVFGGRTRDADGTEIAATLGSVEMYDPATDTWTGRASMPTGRRTMAVGTLNGRAQLIGGERTPEGGVFAQNEEYDPATDTWRPLASMLTPRHGAASATIGGVVYVAGGGPAGGLSLTNVNEAFLF
jgi:N-acetylneuraminic acid mutarotase